ncbi:bifunctional methylenetetrahydrofolate dehydrogenase/methenyltetrahydrofolate cyclohydrolase [Clostridium botulinum C]|uniref:tetrahydrofolate dehydrogenase/cyclohydrolase catalytic domain-containing protein n=1 Tax=Clostridium botulinum TaxID=1491 RepID=UPI001E329B48|nr:tetrahydrofolate dehydrogenase/cyclohydrolase catalytic domain-containing protein [Clostridium botulinum]MCD3215903.1 bifunctional methylenetetrahydrofolate dehydrogenase/methenyltetrahydrofolate cyclohydrolase [Clostridium botulinum C]MCD3244371.1 bifunctional methylenetetrahydrofolate dehydrogenase/methenyltetrahydrofolate cyclohydrolase [Clostridium botulinum C]MCD3260929.1 bifunctional methylenetetrahydrofolate dehydrogenase/methenyltetrahydrofolate cyclohydrolase [Clostridium botulinum C
MGTKIDGKKLAEGIKEELKRYIEMKNSKTQIPICMANILVGNDGGSKYYVNNQNKLCNKLGVKVKSIYLDYTVKEEELLHIINELNKDKEVHGIIIQLPLPEHLDEAKITSSIDVNKDIDGLSSISVGKLYKGENCFVPCTPRGIIEIIKSCNVKIEGSNAVVIGRSNIVGRPVAQLLLKENATVTICHSKTENLKEICSKADILVAAVGKPKFITKEYVKEGAVVIDVGTSSVEGKLVGDVCFDEVIEKAGFVTPVPGGVGAMTTTMLIKNLCEGLK